MRQAPRSPLSFKLQRVANVPERPPPSTRLMSCAHIANRRLSRIIGASGPLIKFSPTKPIDGVAAMLGPGVQAPIIITGLDQLTSDSIRSISEGREFIWLRTIFDYRDD